MEGILPLLKPKGMTSHDCVWKIRKLFMTKKVGHTGTLDPDVTGVLPICIGRATKIAEYITDAGKSYEGEVTIGYSTTTEDSSGEVVAKAEGEKRISRTEVEEVLRSFQGEIVQTPPMYSAVKVNGKKLYEYARAGIEVERPSRRVNIYEIDLLDDQEEWTGETISFRFRVKCSKGTYIRTLAVMIGEKLGFPAHMSHLIRTQSSSFTLKDCYTLEQIEEMELEERYQLLRPLEEGLTHLPKLIINDKVAEKVINGVAIPKPDEFTVETGEPFVLEYNGTALAIYHIKENNLDLMKPVKVLRISLI